MTRKIILTGGHGASTALATIEALNKQEWKWDIYWIGVKNAVEGEKALTFEFKVFPKYGIKCIEIFTGRLQRKWTRFGVLSLLKIPVGFVHAFYLVLRIRPEVIISFGGFAAVPVVFAGWVMGIPVIIHEQTVAAGLGNRLSAPFSKYVAISRKESAKYYPAGKTRLTGNPVREAFFEVKRKRKIGSPPLVLVTGGSRGARSFNKVIREALPQILNYYRIIHQTGDLDFEVQRRMRDELPERLRKRYEVVAFIDPTKMPEFMEKADIIVARAGANTVSEILAAGRPAIFVPIPWSSHNEQVRNARMARLAGSAEIIAQDKFTAGVLMGTLARVVENWNKMISRHSRIAELDRGASEKLADMASELVK